MAGRKKIGKQLQIHAPDATHKYLEQVCKVLGVRSISEAGRLVFLEAERLGVALDRSATVSVDTRREAA